MAFEVVDADHRHAKRIREAMCGARADQQSAGESGPARVGDAADVRDLQACVAQDLARERQEAPDVVAGRKLGNHSAIFGMHGDL